MLGYETYFVAVILITGFLHQCYILKQGVLLTFLMNENSLILYFDVNYFDDILTFKNYCRFDFSIRHILKWIFKRLSRNADFEIRSTVF